MIASACLPYVLNGVMMEFMKRAQLCLDEELFQALRRRAFEEQRSLSAVARDVLAKALLPSAGAGEGFGFAFAGKYASGAGDISVKHDDYLDDGEGW